MAVEKKTKSGTKSGKAKAATKSAKPAGKAAKASKPSADAEDKTDHQPAPAKVPFPKKNQPPSEAEFVARLPLNVGRKFEGVQSFLTKQKGVSEELYYFGPKTGWAYRYLRDGHSVATIMIHNDHLMGILALDEAALAKVDFGDLSEVAQNARRLAHGSPTLSWLDLPLDGSGASDFKALAKAKLTAIPAVAAAPAAAAGKRPASATPPPAPPAQPAGAKAAGRRPSQSH